MCSLLSCLQSCLSSFIELIISLQWASESWWNNQTTKADTENVLDNRVLGAARQLWSPRQWLIYPLRAGSSAGSPSYLSSPETFGLSCWCPADSISVFVHPVCRSWIVSSFCPSRSFQLMGFYFGKFFHICRHSGWPSRALLRSLVGFSRSAWVICRNSICAKVARQLSPKVKSFQVCSQPCIIACIIYK